MAAIFYSLATLKDKLQSADKERGATIVEYALVLAVISLVLLVGAGVMTGAVQGLWTDIAGQLGG